MFRLKFLLCLILCSCGLNFQSLEENSKKVPSPTKIRKIEKFDFKMSKFSDVSGTWLLRNGEPASHVRLDFYLNNKFLKSVLTDSEGRYNTQISTSTNTVLVLIKCSYIGAIDSKLVNL
jgi:hypothetical protein